MRNLSILLFYFITFLLNAQDKTYLAYFETVNMHRDYHISATRIFKTYLNQEKKYDVYILPTTPDSIPIAESYQQAWEHAKELSTKYFIKGEMDRLGETVVVSVSLYKTDDGTKVWTDMLKAKSPEDLDPILLKMAKVIGTASKASEESDIYNVTDFESQQLKQINSRNYYCVSLGGAYVNSNSASSKVPAGFGLGYSHDIRKIIADLYGEGYFGKTSVYFIHISTYYPFKKTNNTPYLGGGLGLGGVTMTPKTNYSTNTYSDNYNETNGGLMVMAGGGYLFNRTSNVRLRAGAKAYLPLFEVNGVLPVGVIFNFEIAFGN